MESTAPSSDGLIDRPEPKAAPRPPGGARPRRPPASLEGPDRKSTNPRSPGPAPGRTTSTDTRAGGAAGSAGAGAVQGPGRSRGRRGSCLFCLLCLFREVLISYVCSWRCLYSVSYVNVQGVVGILCLFRVVFVYLLGMYCSRGVCIYLLFMEDKYLIFVSGRCL